MSADDAFAMLHCKAGFLFNIYLHLFNGFIIDQDICLPESQITVNPEGKEIGERSSRAAGDHEDAQSFVRLKTEDQGESEPGSRQHKELAQHPNHSTDRSPHVSPELTETFCAG